MNLIGGYIANEMCIRDRIEKARDSQLAREIEAALPRELSGEQQLALVRDYVKDNFVGKGMFAGPVSYTHLRLGAAIAGGLPDRKRGISRI